MAKKYRLWSARKIALLTDSNVGPLYLKDTAKQLREVGFDTELEVPAGESSKSLSVAGELIAKWQLLDLRVAMVFALGGGVIGDLGGVVASLYMRGIAFIQIATSLTAQVDSSLVVRQP